MADATATKTAMDNNGEEAVAKIYLRGRETYYEATGVTSGQQHGPTHDSEPPAAAARPSQRARSASA